MLGYCSGKSKSVTILNVSHFSLTSKPSPPKPGCETPCQSTNTTAADDEVRPEGIKAAKANRNTGKGKSVAEYATIMDMKREDWEMKKDDLDRKERLSKLAFLDTLLARTEPLSLVSMGRYSYSQPSSSDPYGDRADSGYSETEELIRQEKLVKLEKLVEEKLAKKKSSVIGGVEVVIGVMLIVLVVIGLLIAFK
ncbi:hypothetical protein YC2023_032253 [Brassica napus]